MGLPRAPPGAAATKHGGQGRQTMAYRFNAPQPVSAAKPTSTGGIRSEATITDLPPTACPDIELDTTHRERPARPGELCDYCSQHAFVVYLTEHGPVRWCGWPETRQDRS